MTRAAGSSASRARERWGLPRARMEAGHQSLIACDRGRQNEGIDASDHITGQDSSLTVKRELVHPVLALDVSNRCPGRLSSHATLCSVNAIRVTLSVPCTRVNALCLFTALITLCARPVCDDRFRSAQDRLLPWRLAPAHSHCPTSACNLGSAVRSRPGPPAPTLQNQRFRTFRICTAVRPCRAV